MRILLIGGGGREHALGWALQRDHPEVTLLVAPGNPGLERLGRALPIAVTDVPALAEAARREQVDLVVAGPEAPLVAGLADRLEGHGIPCFGPGAAAAALEGSKVFAKEVLRACGAPTAPSLVVESESGIGPALERFGDRVVVKADGLAAGKGVLVASSREEADLFARRALSGASVGDAGKRLVFEERLSGDEVSLFYWTNGQDVALLPAARDYKRLADGDRGPNTGGMGATAPHPVPPGLERTVTESVVRPVLDYLAARGAQYRGVLYCGIMRTARGPMVLEFNCRFGDPEAQALLPLAAGHVGQAFLAAARGEPLASWRSRPGAAVAVVLASEGYPEAPRTGRRIFGLEEAATADGVLVFHAGVARQGEELVSAGGRVLTITGVGPTGSEARRHAYDALQRIRLEGAVWRTDVGDAVAAGSPLAAPPPQGVFSEKERA